jgi:predicted ATPase
MTALYRAGRPAESLQAYHRARRILVDELGIEPGPQLRQLEADVLAQSPGLAARPSAVPTNLPSRSASFVGRQREMAELESALMESRLVTLTGPGGCGKTSLAVAACRRVLPDFADGVWFADLAPLASASPVPGTVAAVLGVHQRPDRTLTETVAEYVGAQRTLLVLDNCEHVLESCGQLVDTVLRAGSAVRVVATSREPFGLAGEVVWQVPPLTETDAVTLFTERARSARPGITWLASHRDMVTSICGRLDCLPLAIELAAAQLNVLSVGQISDRLHNALGLLNRPVRGAVPRQRTLRDTLAWSYDLLTPAEQMIFERLSVFPGSFTLEAAEAVGTSRSLPAEDAVGFFTRLVHKSLVLRADDRADGESPRYRLLETVREFGRSRLAARADGTASEAVASHAAYYLDVARQIEPGLRKAGARRWLDLAAAEHHNFRAAIEAMLADQAAGGEVACQFVGALAWGWFLGGRISEPRQWTETVLARSAGELTEARGLALLAGGLLASAQSDLETMTTLSAELADLGSRLGSAHLEATGLDLLGIAYWAQGRLDASIEAHRRSVALYASYGNQTWEAMGYAELGRALADADRPDEARDAHEHAIALARLANEDAALGLALDASAAFALTAGDLDRAASMISEAVEHYRRSGYREGLASGLNTAGTVCAARDDLAEASASFQEALAVCRQIGHLGGAATALAGLADIATRHGQSGRAVRMYAAAAELRRRAGVTLSARHQAHLDAAIRCFQGLLGPAEFGAAWSAGQEVTIDQAGCL